MKPEDSKWEDVENAFRTGRIVCGIGCASFAAF
jgi:hypothetical protein